jgi:hypothetical protein
MQIRMESRMGSVVAGIDPVLVEIQRLLQAEPKKWLRTLAKNPGGLANLELEVHQTFSKMADRLVAGLLAQTTADADFADAAKKK